MQQRPFNLAVTKMHQTQEIPRSRLKGYVTLRTEANACERIDVRENVVAGVTRRR
jgi:hypothetical protein